MKIVHAASEAAPFVKTGGLGDVMQALPAALSRYRDCEVSLFLPLYGTIKQDPSIHRKKSRTLPCSSAGGSSMSACSS